MEEKNSEVISVEVYETKPEDGIIEDTSFSGLGEHGEGHIGYQKRVVTTVKANYKMKLQFILLSEIIFAIPILIVLLTKGKVGLIIAAFVLLAFIAFYLIKLFSYKKERENLIKEGNEVPEIKDMLGLNDIVKNSFKRMKK